MLRPLRHCALACGTWLLAAGAVGGVSWASAATVEGVRVPRTATVSGKQLSLASCGMREMLFMEIYLIALYLPQQEMAPPAIMQPSTSKAVRLYVTYDGSVPSGLPGAWRNRVKQEIHQRTMRELQNLYSDLKTGDVVTIGYTPQGGTTVQLNGEQVIARGNNDLIAAMLEVWIGRDPVSSNLKRLLTDGSCR